MKYTETTSLTLTRPLSSLIILHQVPSLEPVLVQLFILLLDSLETFELWFLPDAFQVVTMVTLAICFKNGYWRAARRIIHVNIE